MPRRHSTQGSLFEEDYLLRTLGSIGRSSDVALTELVANAWDAGATRVEIAIPPRHDERLAVSDNGAGMSVTEFGERWMRLGYNRLQRQGEFAEVPGGSAEGTRRRRAYGRNGVGRHGMLCFANRYTVSTVKGGQEAEFLVATASGQEPFTAEQRLARRAVGHGTTLSASVNRNLPDPERIRRVLSARFLHDPEFTVVVNGQSLRLAEHEGLVLNETLVVAGVTLEIFVIDSSKSARTSQQHGVAFWVGSRLVGEPSWAVGDRILADGRTAVARRHTIVVRTQQLFEEVLPDWSGFRNSEQVGVVLDAVAKRLAAVLRDLFAERTREATAAVMSEHEPAMGDLSRLARLEIEEFVSEVAAAEPTFSPDTMSAAVRAAISLEKSRSGQQLLQRLSQLSDDDVDGLNRILSSWSVRDALSVLDEIDRRLAVVEALGRLSSDKTADELATLHPLVAQARWLFGPEFDSPLYSSSLTLRCAVGRVFGERVPAGAFENPMRRPDLVVLSDGSSLCAVGSEELAPESDLVHFRRVLVVELKRGGFRVTRKEVNQATGYAEDLLNCGLLDGMPFVSAWIVGESVDEHVERVRKIGTNPEKARIEVATYGQLVRTASQRLFRLREELAQRYEGMDRQELLSRTGAFEQLELVPEDSHELSEVHSGVRPKRQSHDARAG